MRTSQAFPAHAGANGTTSPASRSVAHGATTFTVTPETGYSASASGCGGSLSGATYTTGAITAACAVSASFNPDLLLENLTVTTAASYQANGGVRWTPSSRQRSSKFKLRVHAQQNAC